MIITLTGSNSFALKAELAKVLTAFIEEHGDIALERLDGEEASAERMIEAAASLPFLAVKKMVVLRSPGIQKQFAEAIERVVGSVPESTELVIVEPKLDKRSVYFKVLKAKTTYNEFVELDAINLSKWIVQYAKEKGGAISLADARYLMERVGQNQQMLAGEVEKLATHSSNVTRDDIDMLTERSPQSTIFELLDAAFDGDIKKVDRLYHEQRALKVEPQQIIAMIAWQLHVLAVIKTAKGKTPDQIAKEAKLNPFVVRKTANIAQKTTYSRVKQLVGEALDLDVRLKSVNIDTDAALLNYLMTISS